MNEGNVTPNRFYRSRQDHMIAGVCGGLAQYFNIDPVLVRLAFVALTLATGAFLLVYIALAIITPQRPLAEPEPVITGRAHLGQGRELAAYVLLGLGALLLAGNLGLFRAQYWGFVWPLIVIGIGAYLVFRPREEE